MNGYGAPPERPIEDVAAELDALVRAFERHDDPQVRRDVFALLERVDALHRAALSHLVTAMRSAGADATLARALDDPAVRLVLQLYDLTPGDDLAPVELALDQVRPFLSAHGATVRLLGVADGVVQLRLNATPAAGAHVSPATVIEAALRAQFPALRRVEIEEPAPAPAPGFIPLASISLPPEHPERRPHTVGPATEIPSGRMQQAIVGGRYLLVCNVDGAHVAVADRCPGSLLPLSAGALVDGELHCPWHGCRFDARTGRRIDAAGVGLEVFPARVVDGLVQVELPVAAVSPAGGMP